MDISKSDGNITIGDYGKLWFIKKHRGLGGCDDLYLHSTGEWRKTVQNSDEQFTGYYKSQSSAQKMLDSVSQAQVA